MGMKAMKDTNKRSMKTKRPLAYLNSSSPEFKLPDYDGELYEAVVPDTFDVHERARAVQNVMTRGGDPDWDYLMYFRVDFGRNPAIMWHGIDDWCQPKYMQALPFIRQATGVTDDLGVEKAWVAAALKQIGPDGLSYLPRHPFSKGGDWLSFLDDPSAEHYASPIITYLPTFAALQILGPDDVWVKYMHGMVDGFASLAVDKGDWAYIPFKFYACGGSRTEKGPMPAGSQAVHSVGFPVQGLGLCYRVTGYEPAGQLARKMCYFLKDHSLCFDDRGRFLPDSPAECDHEGAIPLADAGDTVSSHFHTHTACLLNMLEYAIPTADQVLLEFIKTSFEWAREQGERTLLQRSTPHTSAEYANEWHLGYFPELLNSPCHEEAETCEIADMIGIGLKLSAAGVGDYWDDVDKWIRNQFAENQLLDTRWAHAFSENLPVSESVEDEMVCEDDVIERNRGAFAGWALPNAWMGDKPHFRKQIMHCCTGNGARALCYIWEHILHHDNGRLGINLLLNRASPWADVDSHVPYQGRVDVTIKQAVDLQIRIPGWADLKQVRCGVNGTDRPLKWQGRYLQVGKVSPGDLVVANFPIGETSKMLEIEKQVYYVVVRGADVVKMDPRGELGPLYQRDHYRTGQTRWRKVQRFASRKTFTW